MIYLIKYFCNEPTEFDIRVINLICVDDYELLEYIKKNINLMTSIIYIVSKILNENNKVYKKIIIDNEVKYENIKNLTPNDIKNYFKSFNIYDIDELKKLFLSLNKDHNGYFIIKVNFIKYEYKTVYASKYIQYMKKKENNKKIYKNWDLNKKLVDVVIKNFY
jgi:hypothetical protein